MDKTELTPFAKIAIAGYFETSVYSRSFKKDYHHPPNAMSKIQHHRSILIARLTDDPRFRLHEEYTQFGRVRYQWLETARDYLLRSEARIAFDKRDTATLLDVPQQYLDCETTMLVFNFQPNGLDLSVAGTRRRADQQKLVVSGPVNLVGTWPYYEDGNGDDGASGSGAFDQDDGGGNPWSELQNPWEEEGNEGMGDPG